MKIRLIACAATAALLLTGCTIGTEEPSSADDVAVGSNSDVEAEAEAEEAEAPAENPKFGETVTYDDGLQITVSKGKEFTPGEWAAMITEWPAYREYTVTVVNNTGANYDASMMYFTLQSGNEEGEEVFDSENGFDGTPSTTLLDGREAKFKIGFGMKDPKDQVMEISSGDWDHAATIFTN